MSKVPWSTFARCCAFLVMVDIRPSIETDGRHSTIDWSRVKFKVYLSNDDFRVSHSFSPEQGALGCSGWMVGKPHLTLQRLTPTMSCGPESPEPSNLPIRHRLSRQ